MSWSAPTTVTFLQVAFMPGEVSVIKSLQGGSDLSATFLTLAVNQVRGFINSGGYPVDTADATTLPPGLHMDCYAIARWAMLMSLPQLKQMQTEDRGKLNKQALDKMDEIRQGKYDVELPVDTTPPAQHTGSWGGENKLIMRTHPVPRPADQSPVDPNAYANPDEPPDSTDQ